MFTLKYFPVFDIEGNGGKPHKRMHTHQTDLLKHGVKETWCGWGKINGCSPGLSQRRVKTLLNSSRADALPNQPASLSLIFYLSSSSDMSSNSRASTACQHINQAPLSPACPVCREQSVNRISLASSEVSVEASQGVWVQSCKTESTTLCLDDTLHSNTFAFVYLFVWTFMMHSNSNLQQQLTLLCV